jgi:hypothetical protein
MSSNPGLGDTLQGTKSILVVTEAGEAFLNSIHE